MNAKQTNKHLELYINRFGEDKGFQQQSEHCKIVIYESEMAWTWAKYYAKYTTIMLQRLMH